MATYLLTGGCGFIGSHICDRLISEQHTVVILDDLSTGLSENLHPHALFYEGNVSDTQLISKIFSEHKYDGIIHEASHINTSLPEEDPKRDLKVNVEGTLVLLDAALEHNAGKFILASSVSVYGSPTTIPVSESEPPKPIFSYGIAKNCGEEYVRYYGKTKGLDYHIARYGNIYGPRQPIYGEVGVIAIFTQNILNNEPLRVFGGGEHLRDFLFIDDAVEATIRLLDLPGSDTFNLASGTATSVNDLVRTFEVVVENPLEIIAQPQRPAEIGKFCANISKLQAAINWNPKVDLQNGIIATLKYYRERQ